MADAVATEVVSSLRAAIERQGRAGVIVSGGSTPRPLFERLAAEQLPWDKVVVTLADDRRVPPDHPASNERTLKETLLTGKAAAARYISLYSDLAGVEAEQEVNRRLAHFPWPAAATLLGMGADGHTASWFPDSAALSAALDPQGGRTALLLTPGRLPDDAPFERITLTLSALLKTEKILVLIDGDAKKASYEKAVRPGPIPEMPIRAVLANRQAPVAVHWAPKKG